MSESWRPVKVKELGTVVTGKTPPTKDKHNFGKGYPFIKPPDLSENTTTIKETETEITEVGLSTLPDKLIPPKSTCVVCIGTIGKKIGLTSLPSVTNQQINSIVVNQSSYDPYFVYYLLRAALPQVKQLDAGSASGRENVNKSTFENIEVRAPSIALQRKIASVLSPYDDLIENNIRRIKILEEMAQTIYNEWFVKFRFPGHENVKMVESELGMIPEGWEVRELPSLADVTYGFAFKSKQFNSDGNGKPVVRIRDVLNGVSNTFSTEEASKKYLVENGDILVGMDGDFHMGFWVGGQAYLVQRVARFQPRDKIGRYHLFLALREPIQHFNATITGTTVAHLGDTHIKSICIKLPKEQLIVQLNNILEPMLDEILTLRVKNDILRTTRDLLLPRLISGEIDVSELDIDVGGITA